MQAGSSCCQDAGCTILSISAGDVDLSEMLQSAQVRVWVMAIKDPITVADGLFPGRSPRHEIPLVANENCSSINLSLDPVRWLANAFQASFTVKPSS